MSLLPADAHWSLARRLHLVAATGQCEYCDGTGDVVSITGEWRGACTKCEAALAARLPVRSWEFDPGPNPERCTCAGGDGSCEGCTAVRQLFEEWATEQRFLDAAAWMAYSRAWPMAMAGEGAFVPVRVWLEEALLPDLLAASEAAEPSGDAP